LAHSLTLLLGADRPSAPDTRTTVITVLVSTSWGVLTLNRGADYEDQASSSK